MLVKYYVAQVNEKGGKRNKLLFEENRDLLFAGMKINFKKVTYEIIYFQLAKEFITVICHELKFKNEESTKNTTSGSPEDDPIFE